MPKKWNWKKDSMQKIDADDVLWRFFFRLMEKHRHIIDICNSYTYSMKAIIYSLHRMHEFVISMIYYSAKILYTILQHVIFEK